MYSLVMMAAVATSGDATSFHWRSNGCCGGAPIVVRAAPVIYSVGCYGCSGCTGCTGCGGYTVGPVARRGYSCTGCLGSGWSCTGCCGGGGGCCGGIVTWATPARVAPPMAAPAPEPAPSTPKAVEKKPASIEIELPAEAKLFVDGHVIPGTGATRSFATPELRSGQSFYYDMAAEILVDGKPVRQELRVVVTAGTSRKQSFGELLAKAQSSKPTKVATK